MPGPRPKPTALKALAGNPGKRKLNDMEPKPAPSIPDAPEHVRADARAIAEWQRIAPQLAKLGLVTRIDSSALAAYCIAYSRWIQAEDGIREHGLLVPTPNGLLMQTPLLPIANKALAQMKMFLAEFGMTPSSRTRIRANTEAADDVDNTEVELFGRHRTA